MSITEKRRSYRADKSSSVAKRLQQDAINVYENALRFHWSAQFINEAVGKIMSSEDYRRLQRADAHFVYGSIETLRRLYWSNVVFSYVVKGKRLSIESEEYRKVPAEYVSKNCAESGAFVYRNDVNAIFDGGHKSDKPSIMD